MQRFCVQLLIFFYSSFEQIASLGPSPFGSNLPFAQGFVFLIPALQPCWIYWGIVSSVQLTSYLKEWGKWAKFEISQTMAPIVSALGSLIFSLIVGLVQTISLAAANYCVRRSACTKNVLCGTVLFTFALSIDAHNPSRLIMPPRKWSERTVRICSKLASLFCWPSSQDIPGPHTPSMGKADSLLPLANFV